MHVYSFAALDRNQHLEYDIILLSDLKIHDAVFKRGSRCSCCPRPLFAAWSGERGKQ